MWWDDWFITYIKGIGRIAVNFETEETANVVIDENGIYHISRQCQYGDRINEYPVLLKKRYGVCFIPG